MEDKERESNPPSVRIPKPSGRAATSFFGAVHPTSTSKASVHVVASLKSCIGVIRYPWEKATLQSQLPSRTLAAYSCEPNWPFPTGWQLLILGSPADAKSQNCVKETVSSAQKLADPQHLSSNWILRDREHWRQNQSSFSAIVSLESLQNIKRLSFDAIGLCEHNG
jgi:hypothetical protein